MHLSPKEITPIDIFPRYGSLAATGILYEYNVHVRNWPYNLGKGYVLTCNHREAP